MRKLLLALLTSFLACLAHSQDATAKAMPIQEDHYESVKVTRVIDGDTLELENGEEVELIGIDCPEIDTEEGKLTKEFVTKTLYLEGKDVRLEFDVIERNEQGQLLAYLYYAICPAKSLPSREIWPHLEWIIMKNKEEEDWVYVFVNATIVKVGYAQPTDIPPNVKYTELFEKLYKEARDNKRGMWKLPNNKYKDQSYCEQDSDCIIVEGCCGARIPMNIYVNKEELLAPCATRLCVGGAGYKNPRCADNKCIGDPMSREEMLKIWGVEGE